MLYKHTADRNIHLRSYTYITAEHFREQVTGNVQWHLMCVGANVKLQWTFPSICSPEASHFLWERPSWVVLLPLDEEGSWSREWMSNQCSHCSLSSHVYMLCLAESNVLEVKGEEGVWRDSPAVPACCRQALLMFQGSEIVVYAKRWADAW